MANALVKFLSGHRSISEPRQGAKPISNPKGADALTDGRRARDRAFSFPARYIRDLSEQDDVIVAIRRTIRAAIGDLEWKIVPDVDRAKADLKAWQAIVELNLALPGFHLDFVPQAIPTEFFLPASAALRDLLRDEHAEGGEDALENSHRLREFFENCLAVFNVRAERHAEVVRRFFERPEPDDESVTFRTFNDRIVDSLTLWDAAPIVKMPRRDGRGLGEIYLLPGDEIALYRRPDLKRPIPPAIAFEWAVNQQVRAYYNALELVYGTVNPQEDGYGKPPVESLFTQIMASLYGDAYLLDFFSNNNTPRGVFDLGPGVDQGERDATEMRWNDLVRQGLRRIMFVSLQEGVKGFIPVPADSNKDSEVLAAAKHWANRKCAVFGLSLNDIGFTEDLHRTTADTQQEMTQSRGINSVARAIAGFYNSGIIKGRLWLRDDPTDPLNAAGHAAPVFPFRDVKFEFVTTNPNEKDEEQGHVALVEAGVKTINEVRKELGFPPVAGGDVPVIFKGGSPIKVADLKSIPGPDAQQQQGEQQQPGQPAIPQSPQGAQQRALPAQAGGHEQRLEGLAKRLVEIIP